MNFSVALSYPAFSSVFFRFPLSYLIFWKVSGEVKGIVATFTQCCFIQIASEFFP